MMIAVITTSRADWASLGMVAKGLREADHNIWVLGVGDWPKNEVAKDGFDPATMGATFWRAAPSPDMAILCGDRHEGVHAAVDLIKAGIPIAHMAGGDETLGSADNLFRHAITKLAHWHFPTNHESGRRIVQLGEDPELIWNVGSASVDRLVEMDFIPEDELRKGHGWGPGPIALLNWQSETAGKEFDGLLEIFGAMADWPGQIIAVGPNPERRDATIRQIMLEVEGGKRLHYYQTMTLRSYLSVMKCAALMIGNSSSGFYEAPYLGTPVVNVGERQDGRPISPNIFPVKSDIDEIRSGIQLALHGERITSEPYGPPGAVQKIVEIFGMVPFPTSVRKVFRWNPMLLPLPNEAPPIGS